MWELIEADGNAVSSRLRVPQGWIVRTVIDSCYGKAVHQVFVQDAGHDWVLGK